MEHDYTHDESLRPTWYLPDDQVNDDCIVCGVTLGLGHCHRCLLIAIEDFECQDLLDEF